MTDAIDRALSTEVLAGIISAPESIAKETLAQLEPDDFPHWIDAAIFEALAQVNFADRQVPGSIIVQVNRHLLNAGRFRDSDDGLRAGVVALAENRGHPEMLPSLTATLIEQRFRRAAQLFALSVADHAANSPVHDLFDALNTGNQELLRLRGRINLPRAQSTVTNLKERSA